MIFFQTAPTRRFQKYRLICNTSRQKRCKSEQKSLQNKSEIFDLFCKRFWSQLRVDFVVYIYTSETSCIYRKFTIYLVGFSVPPLQCILSYVYIGQTS